MVSSLPPWDHAWAASVDLSTFLTVDSFSGASCLSISCHKETFCLQDSELNSCHSNSLQETRELQFTNTWCVHHTSETMKKVKNQDRQIQNRVNFVTLPGSNKILCLVQPTQPLPPALCTTLQIGQSFQRTYGGTPFGVYFSSWMTRWVPDGGVPRYTPLSNPAKNGAM